jgi:hypothetical protein
MPDSRNVDPQVAHHMGRKAAAARWDNPEEAEAADRDLREALLAKAIRELAGKVPPLTDDQLNRLAGLLRGGAR